MSGSASETVDFMIIGAGIFGAYAALHLQSRGHRVLLVERENGPFLKASTVNQARLHAGYHYPRSVATARMAHGHRERFLREHQACVNLSFTNYYGIDRHNSVTDAAQFARFCATVGIPLSRAQRPDIFLTDRLEALFEGPEYSFDPYLLREHYIARLREAETPRLYGWRATGAREDGGMWDIELAGPDGGFLKVRAGGVINAAYANINAVNALFGSSQLDVTHEISEVVLLRIPQMWDGGLTVLDGPFMSVVPYGRSGLHSLTSVPYTHQTISTANDPAFACQSLREDCTPGAIRACTTCFARPPSNARKMDRQMRLYVRPQVEAFVHGSLFTVKTKLKRSFIDDGRPTEISLSGSRPLFACVFSGKINSIYEIERLMTHV